MKSYPGDETRHERDCEYVTSDGPAPCTCKAGRDFEAWAMTTDHTPQVDTAPVDEDGLAKQLAADIMAGVRRANIDRSFSDENQDEFEALTLTPMLAAALRRPTPPPDVAKLPRGIRDQRFSADRRSQDAPSALPSDDVERLVAEGKKRGVFDTTKNGPELVAYLDDRAGMLASLRDEMSEGYRGWLDDAVEALRTATKRAAEVAALTPRPDTASINKMEDRSKTDVSLNEARRVVHAESSESLCVGVSKPVCSSIVAPVEPVADSPTIGEEAVEQLRVARIEAFEQGYLSAVEDMQTATHKDAMTEGAVEWADFAALKTPTPAGPPPDTALSQGQGD